MEAVDCQLQSFPVSDAALTNRPGKVMMKNKGGELMAKIVDTKEYLDVICQLLTEGHKEVPVTVAGSSMTPFLHHGDTVYLNPRVQPPKKGDIVLYTRPGGQYILHRVVKVNPDGSFIMLGDIQTERERIESVESIHGVAVKALHQGKVLTPRSFRWRFFERIWLHMVPLRPAAMRFWKVIRGK